MNIYSFNLTKYICLVLLNIFLYLNFLYFIGFVRDRALDLF